VEPANLLYSIAELWPIIEGLLDISEAKSAVETGVAWARTARKFCEWAAARGEGYEYTAIEPIIGPELAQLMEDYPAMRVVVDLSFDALRHVRGKDLYILDTDHNYHTVYTELALVAEHNPDPHIICVHDIGWPWGRRDGYGNKLLMPPEAIQPHTENAGLRIGEPGVTPDGRGWRGNFVCATHEGGPRNGVLTAVEDFLKAHKDYALFKVMGVFGLAVLVRKDLPNFRKVKAFLSAYADNFLIALLERHRLELYMVLLDAQDERDLLRARLAELEAAEQHGRPTRAGQTIRQPR
jgi:hypothetical protein